MDLKLAEDVCKTGLNLAGAAPAHKRTLLATLTRVQVQLSSICLLHSHIPQRYRGVTGQTGITEKAIPRGPEGESHIVSLLEVLATEPESRKRDYLGKALDLLDLTNR